MKPVVIIHAKLPDALLRKLEAHFQLVIFEKLSAETMPLLRQQLAAAVGIIGTGLRVDEPLLQQAPLLKVASTISVGYDQYDLPALHRRQITLTHTPYVLNDTVADLAFALMLAAARRVCELNAVVKQGQWHKQSESGYFGVDLHHKTLAILGMGRIGQAIAKRAYFGFDMKVSYSARHDKPEVDRTFQAQRAELDQLLSSADFVVNILPLTMETQNLIGEKQFALMKPSAVFINLGRGNTVDEQALYRALKNKQILAAGLDVYQSEPIATDSPLLTLGNIVCLPHIGSATADTRFAMQSCAVDNLINSLLYPNDPQKTVYRVN
ncbi:bifunctional glyoxylate/hydroxypyruvate reductase B [Pasteurellaceae bacterium USgator11]|nr:bifunctional glyoxylate/hydroxypyruvate reductase B [Pasteurellaceae bacterium UScroc12]TNG98569.1 bifunctional glyoxylate/hydroxypyruvate reductase B [Pasteurellaceae bacterium USgator41]TNH00275.1 bifunctional glyoxylate/hydroxypyruvate reductase B [Pasteurellaceae bacterium UScroc31]TNH01494.1 bifunctional glyoxylate/hydroxypyruvate reductase B [Pasteurellaceae bacterium USgator11]